jgi:small subunit ribosomal protein S9
VADRYYGTGHRKNAVAKVWLAEGTGKVTINGEALHAYLGRGTLEMQVRQPLVVTNSVERFDVIARATGGGLSGQAGALRHGIARALVKYDEALKPILRRAGFLTRDSRIKERKKYGRKRARRGFQFSKR